MAAPLLAAAPPRVAALVLAAEAKPPQVRRMAARPAVARAALPQGLAARAAILRVPVARVAQPQGPAAHRPRVLAVVQAQAAGTRLMP